MNLIAPLLDSSLITVRWLYAFSSLICIEMRQFGRQLFSHVGSDRLETPFYIIDLGCLVLHILWRSETV